MIYFLKQSKKKLFFGAWYFFSLSIVTGDIGPAFPVFSTVVFHDYEMDEAGKPSYVVKLHAFEQLSGAMNSPELIVTRWHTSHEADKNSGLLLQSIAQKYKSRVKCFSVNLLESSVFVENLFPIISSVLTKYTKTQKEENPIMKNLHTILASLQTVQKRSGVVKPFFIFFKKGMLLINDYITFSDVSTFSHIVDELISLKPVETQS